VAGRSPVPLRAAVQFPLQIGSLPKGDGASPGSEGFLEEGVAKGGRGPRVHMPNVSVPPARTEEYASKPSPASGNSAGEVSTSD
jgi:hypothetical protein